MHALIITDLDLLVIKYKALVLFKFPCVYTQLEHISILAILAIITLAIPLKAKRCIGL